MCVCVYIYSIYTYIYMYTYTLYTYTYIYPKYGTHMSAHQAIVYECPSSHCICVLTSILYIHAANTRDANVAKKSLMGRIMDWKLLGEQGVSKVYDTVSRLFLFVLFCTFCTF